VRFACSSRRRVSRHIRADRKRTQAGPAESALDAVKFNRDEGEVRIACDRPTKESLRLTVSDTGNGISRSTWRELFTAVRRLGADDLGIEGTVSAWLCEGIVEAWTGRSARQARWGRAGVLGRLPNSGAAEAGEPSGPRDCGAPLLGSSRATSLRGGQSQRTCSWSRHHRISPVDLAAVGYARSLGWSWHVSIVPT